MEDNITKAGEEFVPGPYSVQAAFEIYKMYARESEDLAARRRSYTFAFFPTTSALLIGPFLLVGKDRTPEEALFLSALASIAGVALSLLWLQILFRYRRLIQHRGYWLILLEDYLNRRQLIPPIAQVFTFEWRRMFRYKDENVSAADGDRIKTNISLSEVEQRGVQFLYLFFIASPMFMLWLEYLHMPVGCGLITLSISVWFGAAAVIGTLTRKYQLFRTRDANRDDRAIIMANDELLQKASSLLAGSDWKEKLYAGANAPTD